MSCAKIISSRPGAFTLVEVTLALGIMAFCLIAILGLIPVGLKSNQQAVEELHATNVLTLLEADLRNTYPGSNNGKSKLLGLVLPYTLDASQHVICNRSLSTNKLAADYSTGLKDDDSTVPYTVVGTRYQASVIYTSVPPAGSLAPIQARLIVNWPAKNAASVAALTSDPTLGYVEASVTFPAP